MVLTVAIVGGEPRDTARIACDFRVIAQGTGTLATESRAH